MLCREWVLVKCQGGVLTAEPLKCRCWSCEYCQPLRCARLKRQAYLGRPDSFLTLTVNPARGVGPDDRARGLARAWRLLRLRAIRHYGYKKLPFLAVFEKTKRGEPHLHILLRCKWLDQKWLSAQMEDLIGAPIVDIRRVVGAAKIINYIAKYIGKEPSAFVGTKRYWSSRDWELPDPREEEAPPWEDPTFRVEKMDMLSYIEGALHRGFIVSEVVEEVHYLRYAPQDALRAAGA